MHTKSLTPHNDFFYGVMSQKEHALAFFQKHLPQHLKGRLDLPKLTLCESKSVNYDFKTLFRDTLYQCPLVGGSQIVYLYALCEHQSNPHPHMPLRILEYTTPIIRHHLGQGAKKYPIFTSVVLYTGTKPWNYSPRLGDYYANKAIGEQNLYMAPFNLVNLSQKPLQEILQDDQLGFFKFTFRAAKQQDPFQSFAQALEIHSFQKHILQLPPNIKTLIATYLGHFIDDKKHKLENFVSLTTTNPEEQSKIMTSIIGQLQQRLQQQLQQQYRQEGMQIGKMEGMQIGEQIGEQRGKVEGIQIGEQRGKIEGMQIGEQRGKIESINFLVSQGYLTKKGSRRSHPKATRSRKKRLST